MESTALELIRCKKKSCAFVVLVLLNLFMYELTFYLIIFYAFLGISLLFSLLEEVSADMGRLNKEHVNWLGFT